MTAYRPDRQQILELVAAAVAAPSADNQHRFRLVLRDDGLDFVADDYLARCDEPHRRLLTLLAYGAAVENLRLALTRLGWTFEPHWRIAADEADRPDCLLRIRWATLEAVAAPDPLAARIASRHTNRQLYKRSRVAEPVLRSLTAAVDAHDVTVHWFDDEPRRQALLRMIRFAESARFDSPSLHAELFESIDFSAGWRRTVPERLAPAALEVEPYMRPAFMALRHPRIMRIARLGGVHHMLGLRAGWLPAMTAPHLGALISTRPPDLAALAIGRAFQRLWLAADGAGLALQPMVASAILAWQHPAGDPARVALHRRLREEWRSLIGETPPMVVFRLGIARAATAIAGRKPVEHYLVEHGSATVSETDRSPGR